MKYRVFDLIDDASTNTSNITLVAAYSLLAKAATKSGKIYHSDSFSTSTTYSYR